MSGVESWASSAATRRSMLGNRSGKTRPEKALRKAVFALGMRYRVDAAPIPGMRCRADLLFSRARVAVFLDGCFWHGCPMHYKPPTGMNAAYWRDKIARNQARDRATDAQLTAAGWHVLRCWEHEDVSQVAIEVESAVRDRRFRGGC
ncbi:MAG: very short patch repair endonuclease [Actinomycetes bacterium]